MTNEEIAKIKAEVERLENYYTSVEWYVEALLSFLSTLEEQQKYKVSNPIFDEFMSSVNPKVREEVRRNIDFEQELYNRFGQIKDFTLGMRIGQYFYELGKQSGSSEIPNDLEEAAKNYALNTAEDSEQYSARYLGYKDGAKWQAEHTPLPEDTVLFNKGVAEGRRLERDEFEKNRLAACSNQTEEEYDRETDFALGIIKKEHRQPTFSDAINYGMRLQKEQMLKEAEECELYWDGDFLAIDLNMDALGYSERDKVKIIIVREDEK